MFDANQKTFYCLLVWKHNGMLSVKKLYFQLNLQSQWDVTIEDSGCFFQLLPAIQFQTLNEFMEINSLFVKNLTRQHSRKCQGLIGTE
jgi:hypothetical protein